MAETSIQKLAPGEFVGEPFQQVHVPGFSLGFWAARKFGEEVGEHTHEDPHFLYIVAGRFRSGALEEGFTEAPSLFFNPAGLIHNDHFEAGPSRFFSISISGANCLPENLPAEFKRSFNITSPRARLLVAALMKECIQVQANDDLSVESLCFELTGTVEKNPEIPSSRPLWLKMVHEFICDNFADKFTLGAVSREVSVHPIHLTRTFRKFYRCTPGEFLRMRRLEKAAALMARPGLPLAEIALEAGFSDQSHLTNRFRSVYGFTPDQYRRFLRVS